MTILGNIFSSVRVYGFKQTTGTAELKEFRSNALIKGWLGKPVSVSGTDSVRRERETETETQAGEAMKGYVGGGNETPLWGSAFLG